MSLNQARITHDHLTVKADLWLHKKPILTSTMTPPGSGTKTTRWV